MRLNKLLDQVKTTGSTQAVVAVGGTDVAGWARPHPIGAASVLVVTVGSSIGIELPLESWRVPLCGSSGKSVGLWVELQPAEVEVDGGLEVLAVAVAAG